MTAFWICTIAIIMALLATALVMVIDNLMNDLESSDE